jgi:hypothetical protein
VSVLGSRVVLAVEAAVVGGRDLRLGAVALQRLREADRAGLGEEDQARIIPLIRAATEPPAGE